MNNPEYIIVNDHKYKINTDYRVVLRFDALIKDKNISEYEKIIGGFLMFFGEEGLKYKEDVNELGEKLFEYLQGRPNSTTGKKTKKKSVIDMDYNKDFGLIMASMRSEYGIDIIKEKIHWWTFYDYLNGLSSECALNKVREIRRKDLSKEKDINVRNEYRDLKDLYSLDKNKNDMTKKQIDSVDTFYKLTGIERKE